MQLEYIGPSPGELGMVPLPEGWPASDHAEPHPGISVIKLAFRFSEARCKGWGGKPAYQKPAPAAAVVKE